MGNQLVKKYEEVIQPYHNQFPFSLPAPRIKKFKNFKSTARFTAMLGFLARKRGEVKLVNHSKSVQ